jgi:diketogulonate reductase-like aldo/keto reductase
MDLSSRIELNQGGVMPVLGFGTFSDPPKDRIIDALKIALDTGYRLIDTAMIYQNEAFIGRVISSTEVPREELFVTTKVYKDAMRMDAVRDSVEESLESLHIVAVDLLLIHRPLRDFNAATWHVLEDLKAEGRAKAIGVSNFTIGMIDELKETSTTVPAVDQVEFHPFFYRSELLDYCKEQGIVLESYSPVAIGKRLDDERLVEIATRHGKSPAQVLLRWHLQHGCVPIPRSLSEAHIRENADVFDFELAADEMEEMDSWNEDYMVISPDPDEPAIR